MSPWDKPSLAAENLSDGKNPHTPETSLHQSAKASKAGFCTGFSDAHILYRHIYIYILQSSVDDDIKTAGVCFLYFLYSLSNSI